MLRTSESPIRLSCQIIIIISKKARKCWAFTVVIWSGMMKFAHIPREGRSLPVTFVGPWGFELPFYRLEIYLWLSSTRVSPSFWHFVPLFVLKRYGSPTSRCPKVEIVAFSVAERRLLEQIAFCFPELHTLLWFADERKICLHPHPAPCSPHLL